MVSTTVFTARVSSNCLTVKLRIVTPNKLFLRNEGENRNFAKIKFLEFGYTLHKGIKNYNIKSVPRALNIVIIYVTHLEIFYLRV